MKKNPFIRRVKRPEEMSIQITSMADIFTIILVFLLKSYATSATTLTPTSGLKLAESTAADLPVEALKVEVSESAILVDDKPVAGLEKFRFARQDLQANGVSPKLTAALELHRKRQTLIAQSNSDVKLDAKILIVADSRTPYGTLKSVLASSAIQGYTDFKLVTAKKE